MNTVISCLTKLILKIVLKHE